MKTIHLTWMLLLVAPLLMAQPLGPDSLEQDIVAIVSTAPLPDSESVPGLLTGQRVMEDLRDSLELVRGGVPKAASPGLQSLFDQLHQLSAGDDSSSSPLPASYRSDGELWLPVRAQLLRVQLDTPDLLPRPQAGHAGGQVGNLPAKARRIDWLAVGPTAQRVGQALRLADTGNEDQAQQLLEAAIGGTESSLVLEDRPLILAYYGVEAALAAAPRWDDAMRNRLREAAEHLDTNAKDLADRLQAQADRLTPDLRALQDLALALRKQILDVSAPQPAKAHP